MVVQTERRLCKTVQGSGKHRVTCLRAPGAMAQVARDRKRVGVLVVGAEMLTVGEEWDSVAGCEGLK